MTVAELIEKLLELPLDATVLVHHPDGGCDITQDEPDVDLITPPDGRQEVWL